MDKALSQWSAMNLSFYLDIGSRSLHTPYSQALLCEGMAQMELGKKYSMDKIIHRCLL